MNDSSRSTILGFLRLNASQAGTVVAILDDTGGKISHLALEVMVSDMVGALNRCGIGRGDRVVLVMPPGPALAVGFLGIAAGAIAAPLNPAYLEHEFRVYLQNLHANAVVLPAGSDSPARAAATALGVTILELAGDVGTPGWQLRGAAGARPERPGFAEPEDTALMLHTSGTTSRPKLVPLTQANLCASAGNIGSTLQLQPEDRCLGMMPLFHIHGLAACLLAPLMAGGSTICVGSPDAAAFFKWLEDLRPTWYSAVPTIHQAIVAEASRRALVPNDTTLRFIRSSSSALPPAVSMALEAAFGVPVIEAYGMTEAAHQMTSNPLPPSARKLGSVGRSAGAEITILNADGVPQVAGQIGEVAVRGPGVTRGYVNNPEANTAAFAGGWFRTGDQGYVDPEGYVFITGRLKELINRGGEKIAPREIDEALLCHPQVRQAVAFAVPHPSLGEDIAAAVVLQDDAATTEAELREFALERLPGFKVPSRIVAVSQLPKGATGKVQRIGLAARLADALAVAFATPVGRTETLIAATMASVLQRGPIGRHDNFFALGGDSLRGTQVLLRLSASLHLKLPAALLFRLPTPALLAVRLEQLVAGREVELLVAALTRLPAGEQAAWLEEATRVQQHESTR